jgi:magnesium chelatase family protein
MARAVPSILPPMALREALEVTKIYSVSGMLSHETPLIRLRPFCAPHHTISQAGLVVAAPAAVPARRRDGDE